jgi:hypothetical protein
MWTSPTTKALTNRKLDQIPVNGDFRWQVPMLFEYGLKWGSDGLAELAISTTTWRTWRCEKLDLPKNYSY